MKRLRVVALLSALVLTTLTPIADSQQFASTQPQTTSEEGLQTPQPSRYQASVFINWSGVRSCCDGDRVRAEINKGFARWLAKVKADNPSWRVTSSGVVPGSTTNCHRRRHEGRRRCTGQVTIKVYVEYLT